MWQEGLHPVKDEEIKKPVCSLSLWFLSSSPLSLFLFLSHRRPQKRNKINQLGRGERSLVSDLKASSLSFWGMHVASDPITR